MRVSLGFGKDVGHCQNNLYPNKWCIRKLQRRVLEREAQFSSNRLAERSAISSVTQHSHQQTGRAD